MKSRIIELRNFLVTFAICWTLFLAFYWHSPPFRDIILALPSYFIVTYCSYSLMNVGASVMKIKKCDIEEESLKKDIERAQKSIQLKATSK